ncbi:Thiol-disulfide oxidoreductase ResA [compost metagenome]
MKYTFFVFLIGFIFIDLSRSEAKDLIIYSSTDSATIELIVNGDLNENLYFLKKSTLEQNEDIIKIISKKNHRNIFKITMENNLPALLYLRYQNEDYPIYINEDKRIKIEVELRTEKTNSELITIQDPINTYILKKEKFLAKKNLDLKGLYSLPKDSFLLVNSTIEYGIENLRNVYFPKIADKKFKQLDLNDLQAFFAIRNILYTDYHNYFTKNNLKPILKLDDIDIDELKKSEINLLSQYVVDLLGMYLDHNVKEKNNCRNSTYNEEQICLFNQRLDLGLSLFKSSKIANFFSAQTLLYALKTGNHTFFETNILRLKEIFKRPDYLSVVIEKERAMDAIGKGKAAPDITLKRINSSTFDLSSLKGKKIYLNIWSQGCSSSVQELANINKLVDGIETQSNAIVLNIYIDNNLNELNGYLKKTKLNGLNVTLQNMEDFKKKYFISTLPRYIIINEQGMIDNPFAQRPGSKEVRDYMQKP